MKTLVVEDDFTSRVLLQALMSPYGECHVAINGKEAVRAYCLAWDAGEPYDLICLDIMMPEMDGQAVLQEIRAREESWGFRSNLGATIIMTTALDDAHNIMDAFHGLCDGYLVKPIGRDKLEAMIAKFELHQKPAPQPGRTITLG